MVKGKKEARDRDACGKKRKLIECICICSDTQGQLFREVFFFFNIRIFLSPSFLFFFFLFLFFILGLSYVFHFFSFPFPLTVFSFLFFFCRFAYFCTTEDLSLFVACFHRRFSSIGRRELPYRYTGGFRGAERKKDVLGYLVQVVWNHVRAYHSRQGSLKTLHAPNRDPLYHVQRSPAASGPPTSPGMG